RRQRRDAVVEDVHVRHGGACGDHAVPGCRGRVRRRGMDGGVRLGRLLRDRVGPPAPASRRSSCRSGAAAATTGTGRASRASWSYAFPGSSFPAEGGYTVRVRPTDSAGNAGAPVSTTFVYDATAPTAAV